MKVSEYQSWKFKVLSFFAMILVLYAHAYIPDAAQYKVFYIFEKSIAFCWGRLFFPLFFFISGYLFYVKLSDPDWSVWKQKYRSRVKSLLIPYIIWNILCLLQMFILKYIPVAGKYMNSDYTQLIHGGLWEWIYTLFIVPGGFHLWFIRDLILIVVVSPFLYFCIRKMIFIYFPLIIFFSFYNSWFQSLTMFSIGAACAIYNISLEVKLKHKWGLVLLGTASLLLMLYCSIIFIPGTKELYLVAILFLFVWFLYDYLYRKGWRFDFIKRWIPYTFFIYLLHIPALSIVKKVMLLVGRGEEWSYWITFLVSPFIMAAVAIWIGGLLKKYLPKLYSVLTGGR